MVMKENYITGAHVSFSQDELLLFPKLKFSSVNLTQVLIGFFRGQYHTGVTVFISVVDRLDI